MTVRVTQMSGFGVKRTKLVFLQCKNRTHRPQTGKTCCSSYFEMPDEDVVRLILCPPHAGPSTDESRTQSWTLQASLCSHHSGGKAMWQCGCCFFPDLPRVPVSLLRRPLRMNERRAEPDSTGVSPVSLYGEFTLAGNRKVRCAVSLTETELTVQRLTSAPVERNKVVLSLKDCIGCRAYRGNGRADPAAYFAAYFYPLKRRWVSSGVSRQRVEQSFRLAALQDPRANQEEAEKWARAVRERSARQQYLRDGECSVATRKVYGEDRKGSSA